MHDENYKRIFAFPRVIEDLLRAFVPGDWLEEVDFATLGKLSTEYISDRNDPRHHAGNLVRTATSRGCRRCRWGS